MIDTKVNLGGLELATPVVTASGTFGYGFEYLGAVDYSKLGAVTAKGIRLDPWPGNAMPRHCEIPGGLVNAIGLQGTGVDHFLDVTVPWYRECLRASAPANQGDSIAAAPANQGDSIAAPAGRGDSRAAAPADRGDSCAVAPKLIANIWGGSVEEYGEVARRLGDAVDAIEMNVSCPNVKEGGHTFGQDPAVLSRVVAEVRKATALPLIVKLAPNVPSIVPYAKACEDAGADALSLINTIPAMVIDIEKRRPVLANKCGGMSGRNVHPAAVKLVYDAHNASKLPILAMGGVYEARDAIEFMLAGASAVAVGTAIFSSPDTVAKVYDGMIEYCERHGFAKIADLTGALEKSEP